MYVRLDRERLFKQLILLREGARENQVLPDLILIWEKYGDDPDKIPLNWETFPLALLLAELYFDPRFYRLFGSSIPANLLDTNVGLKSNQSPDALSWQPPQEIQARFNRLSFSIKLDWGKRGPNQWKLTTQTPLMDLKMSGLKLDLTPQLQQLTDELKGTGFTLTVDEDKIITLACGGLGPRQPALADAADQLIGMLFVMDGVAPTVKELFAQAEPSSFCFTNQKE